MRSKQYVQSRKLNITPGDSGELVYWRNTSLNWRIFPTKMFADSSMSCGSGMDSIFRSVLSLWLDLTFRSVQSPALNCIFCSVLTQWIDSEFLGVQYMETNLCLYSLSETLLDPDHGHTGFGYRPVPANATGSKFGMKYSIKTSL